MLTAHVPNRWTTLDHFSRGGSAAAALFALPAPCGFPAGSAEGPPGMVQWPGSALRRCPSRIADSRTRAGLARCEPDGAPVYRRLRRWTAVCDIAEIRVRRGRL